MKALDSFFCGLLYGTYVHVLLNNLFWFLKVTWHNNFTLCVIYYGIVQTFAEVERIQ